MVEFPVDLVVTCDRLLISESACDDDELFDLCNLTQRNVHPSSARAP